MYYYRLADFQCGGYLHTGYNCTSLKDVKDELFDYIEPDLDDEDPFNTREKFDEYFETVLEVWQLELERSKVKFEPNDEPLSEWPKHYQKYKETFGVQNYQVWKNQKWA